MIVINVEQLEKFVIDSGLVSKTDFAIAKKEAEDKKRKYRQDPDK